MGRSFSLVFSSGFSHFHCLALGAAIQRWLSTAACSPILPCMSSGGSFGDRSMHWAPSCSAAVGIHRRKPTDFSDLLVGREAQSLSQKSRNIFSLLFVFIFLLFLPPGVAGRTEPAHVSLYWGWYRHIHLRRSRILHSHCTHCTHSKKSYAHNTATEVSGETLTSWDNIFNWKVATKPTQG